MNEDHFRVYIEYEREANQVQFIGDFDGHWTVTPREYKTIGEAVIDARKEYASSIKFPNKDFKIKRMFIVKVTLTPTWDIDLEQI